LAAKHVCDSPDQRFSYVLCCLFPCMFYCLQVSLDFDITMVLKLGKEGNL
jgi:hypothetical protein